MPTSDLQRPIGDLILAFGLLTRLPLPRIEVDPARSAAASWAWPLVGLVVGAIGATVGSGAMTLGLEPGPAAALALIAMALVTGGLHEDGLADTADGLWGGMTRTRRLEILRDSRVGSYGVLALGLTLLLRFALLWSLAEVGAWLVLPAVAALSRFGMGVLMAVLPHARSDGLSQATGRPPRASLALAGGIALIGLVATGTPLATLIAVGALLLWLGATAQARIGGQTGDILGAGQLLSETAALVVCAAVLTAA